MGSIGVNKHLFLSQTAGHQRCPQTAKQRQFLNYRAQQRWIEVRAHEWWQRSSNLILDAVGFLSIDCWRTNLRWNALIGCQHLPQSSVVWPYLLPVSDFYPSIWLLSIKITSRSDPFCGTSQPVYFSQRSTKASVFPNSRIPDFHPRAVNMIMPGHHWELFNSSQINYSALLITEDWWTCSHCLFGSVSGWIAVKMGAYLCSPQEER